MKEKTETSSQNTFDIGGGGIRFFSETAFNYRETVGCLLYLPMLLRSIKAQGIIIKEDNLKEKEYVLVFTKIDENDRDKIIKKCFEIQLSGYD